jgi:hypothetical protein
MTKLVRQGEPAQRQGRELSEKAFVRGQGQKFFWEGTGPAAILSGFMMDVFPPLRREVCDRLMEGANPYSDVWTALATRVLPLSDGLRLDEEQNRKMLWEAVISPDQAWSKDLLARPFIQLALKDVLCPLTPKEKRQVKAHIYRKRLEERQQVWGEPAKDVAEELVEAYGIRPRKEGNGRDPYDSLDRKIRRAGTEVSLSALVSLEAMRIHMHMANSYFQRAEAAAGTSPR